MKNKTYKNLKELLDAHGCETPWKFGRDTYKYTDCGPWVAFGAANGKDVYYEDEAARNMGQPWIDRCTGLKIGSIVEGSDVNIGPIYLPFPFTEKQLSDAIEQVNSEAVFYWKRDNTDNFTIYHNGKPVGGASWENFSDEPEWWGDVPAKIRKAWRKWYEKNEPRYTDKPFDFGVTGWTCTEFIDDSTF